MLITLKVPGACSRPQGLASTLSLELYARDLDERLTLTLAKAAAGRLAPAEAARAPQMLESLRIARGALTRLARQNVAIAERS